MVYRYQCIKECLLQYNNEYGEYSRGCKPGSKYGGPPADVVELPFSMEERLPSVAPYFKRIEPDE